MDDTQQASTVETPTTQAIQTQPHEEVITYAGYHSIISGVDRCWDYGGFPLPDGSFWRYREPNAVVVVEADKLRVGVSPLTRANDHIQILDNAKNMFFSTQRFTIPDDGSISFEWDMSARCFGTRPRDLYDGFVSVNLLDFSNGFALDFFVCNEVIATVYARLPFPGVPVPDDVENAVKPKYFSDFNELPLQTHEGQMHRYRIGYDKGKDEVRYCVDGQEVGIYTEVPSKIDACVIALGLMTEKSIDHGKSVSVHGQGLVGEWGPFTVTITGNGTQNT